MLKLLTTLIFMVVCLFNAAALDYNKNPIIGRADAPKGGTITIGRTSYPRSLNFPISGDLSSKMVFELVVENLCETNYQTGEVVPLLAKRWEVSSDGKVFTFYLNKKARFADGTPVTAKDVQASWDIIHNPANLIGGVRSDLNRFSKLEVVDQHTIKLHAKAARFSNITTLCYAFSVFSHKHYLADGKDFNKDFNTDIFGSGAYRVDKVKKGKLISLVRNKNYWGSNLPQNIGRYNFDRINFKIVDNATVRYELFKSGKIDMFAFSDAKRWATETSSKKFKQQLLVAKKVETQSPQKFRGIAINTRRKPFDDVRIRKAFAHTFDRKKFINKLFYGIYQPLNSYFPNSIFASAGNAMIEFDLAQARKLLTAAGYTKINKDGLRVKDGKPLIAEYLYASKNQERYLTIWKEDMRKVGIDIKLRLTTWATLMKHFHSKDFTFMFIGWGGDLNPDPHGMWHSKFRDTVSSSNLSGFTSQELDNLLVRVGSVFDRQQRAKIFKRIDSLLFENHPFILGWSINFIRLGYRNKFSFIKGTAPKHGNFRSIWQYAWSME
ncbi:MAG: extracellular solute-binding protein [Pseudomonadota bacterium]|nr:extracellular solute-binding protein [Pseudomonadota bacterium]